MLTDEQITKFQQLYQRHFGKEINREDALDKGTRLVRLIQLIYQPVPRDDRGSPHT